MDAIEELEKRKKELELRRDIARLEKEERRAGAYSRKNLLWVVPLALAGGIYFIIGLAEGNVPMIAVASVMLIMPVRALVLWFRRS